MWGTIWYTMRPASCLMGEHCLLDFFLFLPYSLALFHANWASTQPMIAEVPCTMSNKDDTAINGGGRRYPPTWGHLLSLPPSSDWRFWRHRGTQMPISPPPHLVLTNQHKAGTTPRAASNYSRPRLKLTTRLRCLDESQTPSPWGVPWRHKKGGGLWQWRHTSHGGEGNVHPLSPPTSKTVGESSTLLYHSLSLQSHFTETG